MPPRAVLALAMLAVAALYLAHVASYGGQINDDAFITFRYSKHLAQGVGPFYNVGEHVEGYTNFSLMLLMALVIAALYIRGRARAPKAAEKGLSAEEQERLRKILKD